MSVVSKSSIVGSDIYTLDVRAECQVKQRFNFFFPGKIACTEMKC